MAAAGDIVRMPEFCAPALGNRGNLVTIDLDLPADPHGVLYGLGGAGGGLTCYIDDGFLCFEYNTFIVMRTKIRSGSKLPPGKARIQVSTMYAEARPAGPLNITMTVNEHEFARGQVPVSAPLAFSANDCLDIGKCLGGCVLLDYYDRMPFSFNGDIHDVNVRYTS